MPMRRQPVEIDSFAGVGTVLFDMAVNPANGKVYVANTEARNHVRFEGIVPTALHGVRGHIAESRITVIDDPAVIPHHLNPHIDYFTVPGPADEVEQSLAFPTGLAFTSDGSRSSWPVSARRRSPRTRPRPRERRDRSGADRGGRRARAGSCSTKRATGSTS
jgi:hypothetical protein